MIRAGCGGVAIRRRPGRQGYGDACVAGKDAAPIDGRFEITIQSLSGLSGSHFTRAIS